MIVDFSRVIKSPPAPLCIDGAAVKVISSFKYLGYNNDLTWHANTISLIKKAYQHLYFLRRLEQRVLGTAGLTSFYVCPYIMWYCGVKTVLPQTGRLCSVLLSLHRGSLAAVFQQLRTSTLTDLETGLLVP